jgi:hypothetical protein
MFEDIEQDLTNTKKIEITSCTLPDYKWHKTTENILTHGD